VPPHEQSHYKVPLDIVAYVSKILAASHQPGSLVYGGRCADGEMIPPFKLEAPAHTTSALDALKTGFAEDPRLSAKLESGLIRVTGGNVPRDLLSLRIQRISFRGENDPREAMQQLQSLAIVTDYMRVHHIQFLTVLGGIRAVPAQGGPHLDATFHDVTLSEALDQIAWTFTGIWIYQECDENGGQRAVYIGFQPFYSQPSSP
jgi:hypothetical protein